MTETFDQKKIRLALFARDAVKAKSDYQKDADAVVDRTARLREERLKREAAIPLRAPVAKVRKARATVR